MQYISEEHMFSGAEKTSFPDIRRQRILGLPLVDELPENVARHLLSGQKASVFFLNAHCANVSAGDRSYRAAMARAEYVLPDGVGVELAARMRGRKLSANLNGTDFVPLLLREAASKGLSVYLLGGKPGTAVKAAEALRSQIPGLQIAGTRDGYAQTRNEVAAVAGINASKADIVLVAMGVPLQELWIDRNRKQIDAQLVLGVGALFDFLAGNVRRAPEIVRRARMEWIWRLAMEPARLAKRYIVGNAVFLKHASLDAARNADLADVQKRALDIGISTSALVLVGLPMLCIAAAIRVNSKGPALFRQTRIGHDGKPFEMLKFRSMRIDAEAQRDSLLATSDRQGICFKSRTDPRVTRIGRVLRRTSVDELPQLINVLKGHMSIVGPRPALPEEVAAYPAYALERLQTRPGITGIWQVSGRANIGFDKMVDMDLAYVQSRSVLLDILLIALTFRAVSTGRGAY
ncbi:MAG: WecB/TagA/CpsF family glycosyltransferase [Paracoccaceae bacterium]|nr:WecB/TagA/CpsF family glycosyltransferase [Paracoccaceae bacterium]